MRLVPILAVATIACNALVGFGDLTKQPSGPDAGVRPDDDDGDDDDDGTSSSGASGAAEGGSSSGGGACNPAADFDAPVALQGPVNSASFESSPSLTDDELTMVFQRSITDSKQAVMIATRPTIDTPFGEPAALELTNGDLSFMPSITRDGLTLFWAEVGDQSMDVFFSTRNTPGADWEAGVATGIANATLDEASPVVTADGDEMFFASGDLGTGKRKLSHAIRTQGEYKNPQRLTELDSDGDEQGIAVSKDGLTIFYGSSRSGGAGALDVWTAHRNTRSEKFGAPTAVTKVNSASVDWPSFISADGCRLYLGSEREGAGNLYVATKPR